MDQPDRRRAQRSHADLILELYEPEGRLMLGVSKLLDVSTVGVRIETSARLQGGFIYRARVRFDKNKLLEVPVKVAWSRHRGTRRAYGLEFVGITKTDLGKMEAWVNGG